MSKKREIEQHAREIHFAGLEPVFPHNSGLDISTQQVLTPAPSGSNMLLIQSLDQNSYYTLDGTTPVATGTVVGFLLKADDPVLAIPVGSTTVVKVVEATATANLQYQWSL